MNRVALSQDFLERTTARRWSEFTERACQHFRALHAEGTGSYDAAQLEEAARQAVQAARAYGNDSEGGILDYLTLVYMLGREFATDPQYATWIGPWLEYHQDNGERLKVEHIIAEALPFADAIEPTLTAWRNALAMAQAGLDAATPLAGGQLKLDQAVQATGHLLAQAWPQRWQHLPPEQLPACLIAYNATIGGLRLRTGGEVAAFALLALRFGAAFCDEVRFDHFRRVAAHPGSGRDRIEALLEAAGSLPRQSDNFRKPE